ncbi:MAG: ABC transporter ATP-binding protein [Solirubrobacterales bacterium]
MSDEQTGLVLKDVFRIFPGDVVAVSDVNLHVQNGEYIVFLGPSGCGKTTTLRLIGGHDDPSSGTITIDGEMMNGVSPAERPITTVFQHYALFPHKSVLQNVAFGLKMQGVDKAEREAQAKAAIDLVGLTKMMDRKPRELSGGQQQRVALARVLVTRPKAILLDEPLGDLDRLLQMKMRVELRALQRELGITFIHVTHNQEEALSMADRIVVMGDAVIQQVGSPEELARHPRNEFVAKFMGDNNVFHGTISGTNGGNVVIDTPHGTVEVPGTGMAGQPGSMAIRASAVKISTDATPAVNGVKVRLDFAEYLGDSVKLHLDLDGQPFMAKVHEDRYAEIRVYEGKDVTASWAIEDGHLLEQ